MAITASDINFYQSTLTGGISLGGAIGNQITTSLNSLFDDVTGEEAAAGATHYRAFFVKNTHATLTWKSVKYYIYSDTAGDDTIWTMPESSKGVTGKTSIANETTDPASGAGGSWSIPTSGSPTVLGQDLAPNEGWQIWVKRVIPAGCTAQNSNSFTIRFIGDTQAS